jgi:adenylate kinase family enzyme
LDITSLRLAKWFKGENLEGKVRKLDLGRWASENASKSEKLGRKVRQFGQKSETIWISDRFARENAYSHHDSESKRGRSISTPLPRKHNQARNFLLGSARLQEAVATCLRTELSREESPGKIAGISQSSCPATKDLTEKSAKL